MRLPVIVSLRDMIEELGLADLINEFSYVCAFGAVVHNQPQLLLDHEQYKLTVSRFVRFAKILQHNGLPVSALHVQAAITCLKKATHHDDKFKLSGLNYHSLGAHLQQIGNGLHVEASTRVFLSLNYESKDLFENLEIFGSSVSSKFPSLAYDAGETSKCLALERWTASAFHAIRCLEAAIRAVSRCLGILDPTKGSERNWSDISRKLKAEMDRRWPTATDKASSEFKEFDRIYGAVTAMQNPYRNETMHLDARYDEGEAKLIVDLVRGLLSLVAKRCDEDGNPKA
jgi:hypothetical protein